MMATFEPIITYGVFIVTPGTRIEVWTTASIHEARSIRDKVKKMVTPSAAEVIISRRSVTIEDIE